jgi:hypothetical protein
MTISLPELMRRSSIYTSEIFPNNVRGKGMAIAVGSYFLILVVQLDTAPTALANIGWR